MNSQFTPTSAELADAFRRSKLANFGYTLDRALMVPLLRWCLFKQVEQRRNAAAEAKKNPQWYLKH